MCLPHRHACLPPIPACPGCLDAGGPGGACWLRCDHHRQPHHRLPLPQVCGWQAAFFLIEFASCTGTFAIVFYAGCMLHDELACKCPPAWPTHYFLPACIPLSPRLSPLSPPALPHRCAAACWMPPRSWRSWASARQRPPARWVQCSLECTHRDFHGSVPARRRLSSPHSKPSAKRPSHRPTRFCLCLFPCSALHADGPAAAEDGAGRLQGADA